MKSGIELIAAERKRQVESEGWTAEHDQMHDDGELADAAICYAMSSMDMQINIGTAYVKVKAKKALWPWAKGWWRPTPHNRVKELVKAGALIAAEIDRLQAK